MPTPRYRDVKDRPLPTDTQLIPHLQAMLEGSYRRQVWLMLLDDAHRPLPIVAPTDVPPEPDPEELWGFADFFRCAALEFPGSTIVLTFERPGPAQLMQRDRRWLRLLREAATAAEFPFRGPYLLIGSTVRQVAPDEYLSAEWLDLDDL